MSDLGHISARLLDPAAAEHELRSALDGPGGRLLEPSGSVELPQGLLEWSERGLTLDGDLFQVTSIEVGRAQRARLGRLGELLGLTPVRRWVVELRSSRVRVHLHADARGDAAVLDVPEVPVEGTAIEQAALWAVVLCARCAGAAMVRAPIGPDFGVGEHLLVEDMDRRTGSDAAADGTWDRSKLLWRAVLIYVALPLSMLVSYPGAWLTFIVVGYVLVAGFVAVGTHRRLQREREAPQTGAQSPWLQGMAAIGAISLTLSAVAIMFGAVAGASVALPVACATIVMGLHVETRRRPADVFVFVCVHLAAFAVALSATILALLAGAVAGVFSAVRLDPERRRDGWLHSQSLVIRLAFAYAPIPLLTLVFADRAAATSLYVPAAAAIWFFTGSKKGVSHPAVAPVVSIALPVIGFAVWSGGYVAVNLHPALPAACALLAAGVALERLTGGGWGRAVVRGVAGALAMALATSFALEIWTLSAGQLGADDVRMVVAGLFGLAAVPVVRKAQASLTA